MQSTSAAYETADYEVFGKVQGVYFRKNTEEQAKKLGLVGWVMNTKKDTVKGTIQGPSEKMTEMKHWLSKVGSPASRIDNCVFSKEEKIAKLAYKKFEVRR